MFTKRHKGRVRAASGHAKVPSKQHTRRTRKDVARKKRLSAQEVLAYQALTDTGIADLGDGWYSLTLALSDIDYQIAPQEYQQEVVENYAKFINQFSVGINLEVSVVNRVLDPDTIKNTVFMPAMRDGSDVYREEINSLVAHRLATGRNNTVTDKYLTITVQADDFDTGATQLRRAASEAIAALRQVGGARARELSGVERAEVLHRLLRPGEPFGFTYESLIGAGLRTKDIVCPWEIDFSDSRRIRFGNHTDSYYQVLCLRDLPNWLNDRLIKEVAEIPVELTVSVHVRPIGQAEGLAMVKRQIAGMEMQIINEKKKAAKQSYDDAFIPHELKTAYVEADNLRAKLEQSNEKLFSSTILVGVSGRTPEELAENVSRVRSVGEKHSCVFEDLRYMQEDALNAVLPLGVCKLPIYRTMTTAMAAILVPFTTQELMHPDGLFYGVNALSKNLIIGARTATMNGNAFVLGTTGSGKSQFSKFEAMSIFLSRPDDDIIIIDPEKEYVALGEAMGATRIDVSARSAHCINPLHLDRTTMGPAEGDPVKEKSEFVLSLCEVLIGGHEGLSAAERSILDRAATAMFHTYWAGEGLPPTLADLHEQLRSQPEPEAARLATSLELYSHGTFAGFAQQTNVDTSNRVTCYDISELSNDLKTFGMMVVLEEIWRQVARNRAKGRRTWLYIDEFHLLFANEYAARYCQMLYKRARKWGLMPTGITQNIEELLANERARLMLANCDVLFLLNQQATDADALQDLFTWSDQQRQYFTNVAPGTGLMRMGRTVIPFDNTMPTSLELYRLFTTKFDEVAV